MMCSARKLLALSALGLLVAGCYDTSGHETMKLNPAPILEDDAMAMRQWDLQPSYYANGTSVAGPYYFNYAPRTNVPEAESIVTGPVIFVAQVVTLPVGMAIMPPWTEVTYRGVYVPPTYTAAPAAPNDATWFQTVKYPVPAPRQR